MQHNLPLLALSLPELTTWIADQAQQIETGTLQDAEKLVSRIHDFFTADQMAWVETVAPGWEIMASYADGATLVHVTQALIALHLLPEYRQAVLSVQTMMAWSVLYHDLGKQVVSGQRDALHGFRSAALTAQALPHAGFPVSELYSEQIDPWVNLVLGASLAAPDGAGLIQDNQALPEILQGSERLFGAGSPAALIVQAVLLHQSLTVVPEWPNAAPLAVQEIPHCISPALLPILEVVMLVDSDAWQLFDPASKQKFRQCTLDVFAGVRRLVGG